MVKRQICLTADIELIESAISKGINISQLLNDVLKEGVTLPEEVSDLEIRTLKARLTAAEHKLRMERESEKKELDNSVEITL